MTGYTLTEATTNIITSSIEVLDAVRADLRTCRAQTTTFRRYDIHGGSSPGPVGSLVEIVGGGCVAFWGNDRIEILQAIDAFFNAYRPLFLRLVDSGDSVLLRDRLISGLTPKLGDGLSLIEMRLARLVAQGLSNKEIGVLMSLAESTIKNRLSVMFEKLGVQDRTQLAIKAHDMRLIPGFGPDEMDEKTTAPAYA